MTLKRILRRTTFLIYPGFQLRLIAVNIAVGLVVYLAMSYRLSLSFESLRQEALGAGIQTNDYFYRFLNHQGQVIFYCLFASLAVSVAVACLTTLWVSHKLAGPMIRLRGYMKQIAENPAHERTKPLRFRREDCFREIPPLVNRAVRLLQKRSGSAMPPQDSASRSDKTAA